MKTGEIIEEGTILVAIEDQFSSCGILYIRKDSIIKTASTKSEWKDSVIVYRNKDAEACDNYHYIDIENVRKATDDEIILWEDRKSVV